MLQKKIPTDPNNSLIFLFLQRIVYHNITPRAKELFVVYSKTKGVTDARLDFHTNNTSLARVYKILTHICRALDQYCIMKVPDASQMRHNTHVDK